MRVKLAQVIGKNCSSLDDGGKVYRLVFPEIKNGSAVELDFSEVQSVITPFLNASVGKLLEAFGRERVMEKLVLCNISAEHLSLVNRFIDRTYAEQNSANDRELLRAMFDEDDLGDSGL